jgi:hypothetical protein
MISLVPTLERFNIGGFSEQNVRKLTYYQNDQSVRVQTFSTCPPAARQRNLSISEGSNKMTCMHQLNLRSKVHAFAFHKISSLFESLQDMECHRMSVVEGVIRRC